MHMSAFVLIPIDGDPAVHVERLMAPHCGKDGDNEDGWWDWWVIGGRHTGWLSGYDPRGDPKNKEPCSHCNATGTRPWPDGPAKCNACKDGVALKWPTQWVQHHGDVVNPKDITADKIPYTLIAEGVVLHQEMWNGKSFTKTRNFDSRVREAIRKHGGRVVMVDYHN